MRMFGGKKHGSVVGVEFSDDGLAVALMQRGAQGAVLEYSEFHRADQPAQAETLHELVQRRRLKGAACVGVLPHGSYDLLQVEPPAVPPEERAQAVRWRLRDLLDYPLEEAVVEVFEPPANANRKGSSLNAVVCHRTRVARAAEAARAAGLELRALDIVELAQRNLIAALPGNEHGVALLTLGGQAGLITLVRQAELYLARDLDIGLTQLRAPAGDDSAEPAVWQTLVLELQRSLDYYESNFAVPGITRLLVHPPDEGVAGLLDYLRRNLPAVQSDVLDPATVLSGGQALAPGCLNALGAALRAPQAA